MHRKNISFTSPAPELSNQKKMIYVILIFASLLAAAMAIFFHVPRQEDNFSEQKEQKLLWLQKENEELAVKNRSLEDQLNQFQQTQAAVPAEPSVKKEVFPAEQQEQIKKLAENLQKNLSEIAPKESFEVELHEGHVLIRLAQDALFKNDSTYLHAKGQDVMKKMMGTTSKELKEFFIDIEGHTDAQPLSASFQNRFDSNWELSAARASIIACYLEKNLNVPASRLSISAFGNSRPLINEKNAAADAKNRRIEITISVLLEKK